MHSNFAIKGSCTNIWQNIFGAHCSNLNIDKSKLFHNIDVVNSTTNKYWEDKPDKPLAVLVDVSL